MTGEMCPLGEGIVRRKVIRGGKAIPVEMVGAGLATGSVAAFGNAGRSVTDGAKCVRPAFIDRDWCWHLVAPTGGVVCCLPLQEAVGGEGEGGVGWDFNDNRNDG